MCSSPHLMSFREAVAVSLTSVFVQTCFDRSPTPSTPSRSNSSV